MERSLCEVLRLLKMNVKPSVIKLIFRCADKQNSERPRPPGQVDEFAT